MFRPAIIFLLMLSGCTHDIPKNLATEVVDPTAAYLYGKFFIEAPSARLSLNNQINMRFVVKCDDGSNYLLKFDNKSPLFAIKVKPSNCSVKELIFSDADGSVRKLEAYRGNTLQAMTLQHGYAYYLGDYAASLSTTLEHRESTSQYRESTWQWSLQEVARNFSATTAAMQASYPALASLPTMDLTDASH